MRERNADFEAWYLLLDPDFDRGDLSTLRGTGKYFYTTTEALYQLYTERAQLTNTVVCYYSAWKWALHNLIPAPIVTPEQECYAAALRAAHADCNGVWPRPDSPTIPWDGENINRSDFDLYGTLVKKD